jgi:hypothetical protein
VLSADQVPRYSVALAYLLSFLQRYGPASLDVEPCARVYTYSARYSMGVFGLYASFATSSLHIVSGTAYCEGNQERNAYWMSITIFFSFFACSGCPVFELVTTLVVASVIFILWTSTPLIQDLQLISFVRSMFFQGPISNKNPTPFISPKRDHKLGFVLLRWSEKRSNQRQESPEIVQFTKPTD